MKYLFLTLLLLVAGCRSGGFWHTHRCSNKDPLVTSFEQPYEVFYRTEGFKGEQKEALKEAMAVWQMSSGGRIVWIEGDETYDKDAHVLLFVSSYNRIKSYAKNTYVGLYDSDELTIYIVTKLINSPEEIKVVLEHEIGHYFGLAHVSNDVHSIMHKTTGAMDDPGLLVPLHDRVEFYNNMCGYTDAL